MTFINRDGKTFIYWREKTQVLKAEVERFHGNWIKKTGTTDVLKECDSILEAEVMEKILAR